MKRVLMGFIRLYQRCVSTHSRGKCRYLPTCSQYALEAVERFGAVKGGWLAVKRVLRCNPWGGHGYDPVPDEYPKKKR